MKKEAFVSALIVSLILGIALSTNFYFYYNVQKVYLSPGEEIGKEGIIILVIIVLSVMILSFLAVYFGVRHERIKYENKNIEENNKDF